jgi:hypothetical protein
MGGMMGSNNSDGSGNATAIRELATGEVGISEDMVGQALQEALNYIVCILSTMKGETGMGGTQNNLTGRMEDGMMMR